MVGHGSKNAQWYTAMDAVVETLRDVVAPIPVKVAYLDNHPARFVELLPQLHEEGHRIAVVPLLMAPGGHLLSDIRAEVKTLNDREENARITVLPTWTEYPEVRDAFSAGLKRLLNA